MSGRRVKIVCTLGPASRDRKTVLALARAGMDVARLNFSHGKPAEHAESVRLLRQVSREVGRPLGILADLSGPKIRIGEIEGGVRSLRRGEEVVLSSRLRSGGDGVIGTTYAHLAADLAPGHSVLLDDGQIRLRVTRVQGDRVRCKVVEGGALRSHKGINLPGVPLSAPALTRKDRQDLAFALEAGVDLIALSFVRRAEDVRQTVGRIRRLVGAAGRRRDGGPPFAAPYPPLIAKLEKPQALEDLDGVLAEAAAVMVARGDLGVEISPERVPTVQKRIIRRANALGRPVITATQMLESMTQHSRPTRAEASDVANAVLDGTDAVMLSAETAMGRYPVEAVRMMDRIIRETESHTSGGVARRRADRAPTVSAEDAVSSGAVALGVDLGASAIVAFTRSGSTAVRLACRRPQAPVVAFSTDEGITRRLALVWGVTPRLLERSDELSRLAERADRALLGEGLARKGDRVVLVMGYPPGRMGRTNLVKAHVVGEGR